MYVEQIMTMLGLSDLQLALAVIGLLILISVAVINIKYSRARRKAKELSEYSLDDRFAREPSFGHGFADGDAGRAEPSFGETITTISAPEKFAIDPRIDCVITLRFDEAISGAEILEEIHAWTDLEAQSTARWMCEGLNADIDAAEDWEEIKAEGSYSELQLAIQLASRKGPIGVLELSDFCSRAQALAETLGSQIDMPSVSTMLDSAKELDVMAAESDIQLSINVLFDEPCPWGNFDALMRQRGFKLARNGRQYEYQSKGLVLFNSSDLDPNKSVTQVTLLLEVPLVPQEERAFERMLAEGVEIAQAAHGRLVDDNGINLSEAAVISIRQHLDILYANLEKSGIPAGSSTASRLFS
ncbi:cell division protein ZipA C-terminal FtsZ-binding domain-containing protein [Polynucleobacter sp. JS-JIR-II-c23]|uniref:cell division protein ZipA C-terminal FtsZ-binding domain-containing protein n=1 Tax=Polynucleobacter sp. JS-JIR-II-c23 TaxID=1758393 RepID=UPI002B2302B8|nr:cell division protein ZipA C-terminal FtsZ-binding domain-containing protein [Polynucleobacter sp. JS-JIR-II-c23]MEA9604434.1 cell division protein ZipA C-terminal FtsZ-binding domain-containing protein [Polynucleobacter sp. JS-JIR-II-c23]